MSTKIYNGFKLKDPDMGNTLKYFKEIRKTCVEKINGFITDDHLKWLINFSNLENDHPSSIFDKLKNHITNPYGSRSMNFSFSAVLYPDGNETYGVYFCDLKYYPPLLMPLINDFHYQNSGDPPTDIPFEEWEARSDKWEELVGTGSFASNGFTYTFVDANDLDITVFFERIENVLKEINQN